MLMARSRMRSMRGCRMFAGRLSQLSILDISCQTTVRPGSSARRLASWWVIGATETLGEFEKLLLLALLGLDAVFHASMRLELSMRVFAGLRTWAATFTGRLTLERAVLFAGLLPPIWTRMVRPSFRIEPSVP
jgi:hypothetical protein